MRQILGRHRGGCEGSLYRVYRIGHNTKTGIYKYWKKQISSCLPGAMEASNICRFVQHTFKDFLLFAGC